MPLKTVFSGSRMDVFEEGIPECRSGNEEHILSKLHSHPCYGVIGKVELSQR